MTMWRFMAALTITALTGAGCESDEELIPVVVHTPLELDPTHDIEVASWWASDRELLHLMDDGRYAVYEGPSRYTEPVEEGRWSRGSYVVIFLEPYTSPSPVRERLTLSKLGDELVLNRADRPVMHGSDAPPVVVEDLLFERWVGDGGTLHLHRTMSYSFVPADDAAGHGGEWEVEGEDIVLHPRTPTIGAWRLEIHVHDDNAISLESDTLTLRRAADAAG